MNVEQVAGELAQMRIEPGLWELGSEVVEVRAPDLPREVRDRMVGPRRRLRHCITAEQAARPGATFFAGGAGSGCVYRHFAVRNGGISGAMSCPEAWTIMAGRYGPQSYDMRMGMATPAPGGAIMTLELRATGRRIGACRQGGTR